LRDSRRAENEWTDLTEKNKQQDWKMCC
jgi:hypothetical protein